MFELKLIAETMADLRALAAEVALQEVPDDPSPVPVDPTPLTSDGLVLAPDGQKAAPLAVAPAVVPVPPAVPPVHTVTVTADITDTAGTPWDSRIHTASQGTKVNGEWKRKPGISNEEYDRVKAEIADTPQPAAAPAPVAVVVPPVDPAPAPAPALGSPNLNDVMAKSAELVTRVGACGPLCLTKVLSQFGALVDPTEPGQPPMPTVAALELHHFGAFLQTCDVLIANAHSLTLENLDSMVEILIVRTAS